MDPNELDNQLKGECKLPTKDNPFMNPLIGDENNDKSCQSYDNKGIQRLIEDNFNKDL